MVYLDLPTGAHHGWGICGDHLGDALSRLMPVVRVDRHAPPSRPLDGPLLQSVDAGLSPHTAGLHGARRIGYVMFEEDEIVRRTARTALAAYEAVAAASRWGAQVLRDAGLTAVTTIPQGIDTSIFNASRASRPRRHDRFVIFSGGKFELRKAQDLVARAFRIFATRHADAHLVAAWHNPFRASAATMIASPYLPFQRRADESFADAVRRWLTHARVPLDRVELLPPLSHAALADVYADTDVGLFPNRCEGATNLVLMEYMACGRPAIATDFSGHRDLLTDANSLPLRALRTARSRRDNDVVAHWCEPDVDEIVEQLERAYTDRARVSNLGRQAAADLATWTWDLAGERFARLLVPAATPVSV
jgi:glycosyltransferase involved in cell wall biosynthesis